MEPFYINVGFKQNVKENYSSHEGEEFIFVLEGKLEIFYGKDRYELTTGDSIYYDSIVPLLVTVPDEKTITKILAVTYTPN